MEGINTPAGMKRKKFRQGLDKIEVSSPSKQRFQRLGRQLSTYKKGSQLVNRGGRKRKNSSEDVSENANNLEDSSSAFPGIPLKKRRKNNSTTEDKEDVLNSPPRQAGPPLTLPGTPTSPRDKKKDGKKDGKREVTSPSSLRRRLCRSTFGSAATSSPRSPRWSMNAGVSSPRSPRSPRWSMVGGYGEEGMGGGEKEGGSMFASCRRPLSFGEKGGGKKGGEDKIGDDLDLGDIEFDPLSLPPSPSSSKTTTSSTPLVEENEAAPPPSPTPSPVSAPTYPPPNLSSQSTPQASSKPSPQAPSSPSSPPPPSSPPQSPSTNPPPRGLYLSPSIRDRQLLLSSCFSSSTHAPSSPRPSDFPEGREGGDGGESIVQQRRALFEKLASMSHTDEGFSTLSRGLTTPRSTHPLAYTFFTEGEEGVEEGGEGEEGKKVVVSEEMKQALEGVFGSLATRLKSPQTPRVGIPPSPPHSPSPPPSPSQPSPPSPSSPCLDSSLPPPSLPPSESLMDSPKTERRKRRYKSARKELSETEFSYCSTLSMVLQQYHHPLSSLLPKKHLKLLFSNISELHSISAKLSAWFGRWEADEEGNLRLYDILSSSSEKLLDAMVVYCDHYERCFLRNWSNFLEGKTNDFKKSSAIFHSFLQKANGAPPPSPSPSSPSIPPLSGHDLQSKLVSPCQRMPRYQLLLREILAHSEGESEVVREDLRKCLKLVKGLVEGLDVAMGRLYLLHEGKAAAEAFGKRWGGGGEGEGGGMWVTELENEFSGKFLVDCTEVGVRRLMCDPPEDEEEEEEEGDRVELGEGRMEKKPQPLDDSFSLSSPHSSTSANNTKNNNRIAEIEETNELITLFGNRLVRITNKKWGKSIIQVVPLDFVAAIKDKKNPRTLYLITPHTELILTFSNDKERTRWVGVLRELVAEMEKKHAVQVRREGWMRCIRGHIYKGGCVVNEGTLNPDPFQVYWMDSSRSFSSSTSSSTSSFSYSTPKRNSAMEGGEGRPSHPFTPTTTPTHPKRLPSHLSNESSTPFRRVAATIPPTKLATTNITNTTNTPNTTDYPDIEIGDEPSSCSFSCSSTGPTSTPSPCLYNDDPSIAPLFQTLNTLGLNRDHLPDYEEMVKKVKGSIIQQKKLLAQREGKEYVLSKEEEEWVEEGAGGGVAEKGTPKRGVKLSSLIKGSPASKRHRILFN